MRRLKQRWDDKKLDVQLGDSSSSSITNLRFADDILLVGRTLPQIRQLLSDAAHESAKIGLELHPGKPKILHNGIGYGSRVSQTTCNGMEIEVLGCQDSAMYLGRSLKLAAMHDQELSNRLSKAWAKYGIYKNELTDKGIGIKERLKLFNAVITPTVLYGCSCWAMTTERQRRLRTTQRRMMIMIAGRRRKYIDDQKTLEEYIPWPRRATHEAEQFMDKYDVCDWVEEQRKRQRQWSGKVARATDNRWSHEVLFYESMGTRPCGRPCTRWANSINHFLMHTDRLNNSTWIELARDTATWTGLTDEYVKF